MKWFFIPYLRLATPLWAGEWVKDGSFRVPNNHYSYSEGPVCCKGDKLLLVQRPNVFKIGEITLPVTLSHDTNPVNYPIALSTTPFDPSFGKAAQLQADDKAAGHGSLAYYLTGLTYERDTSMLHLAYQKYYNVVPINSPSMGYSNLELQQFYGPWKLEGQHACEVGRYLTQDPSTKRFYCGNSTDTGSVTNWGPSLYRFQPGRFNGQSELMCQPLLEFPYKESNDAARQFSGGWDQSEEVKSVCIIDGVVHFFGRESAGKYWYGTPETVIDGVTYRDPCSNAYGQHGEAWRSTVWRFPKLLTTGEKDMERIDLTPYLIGVPCRRIHACWNADTRKLYLIEAGAYKTAIGAWPVIHQLNVSK